MRMQMVWLAALGRETCAAEMLLLGLPRRSRVSSSQRLSTATTHASRTPYRKKGYTGIVFFRPLSPGKDPLHSLSEQKKMNDVDKLC